MNYRDLIKDLKGIVDDGLSARKKDSNIATTYTNWEIGKRLVYEDQSGKSKAEYGKQILEKISEALKKRYGRGFGISNLRYMRQFFQMYKKTEINDQLAWTHYLSLIKLSDKKVRKRFERLTIQKQLNPIELEYQVKKYLYGNVPDEDQEALDRPKGVLGVLQIRHINENGILKRFLDFGFNIWIESIADELDNFEHKQLVQAQRNKSELKIENWSGDRNDMWLYKAYLDRVVDGDTIVVYIDCSLGVRTHQVLRLHSVNVAPLTDKSGLLARDFMEKLLNKASFLLIKTRHRDKYARYIADILIGMSDQNEDKVIENGLFLNQELLDHGFALKAG